jgi:hypothetical protein
MTTTPELSYSAFFPRTPPSIESHHDAKKLRKSVLPTLDCAVCHDPLSMHSDGEKRVELTCGDFCHLLCYMLCMAQDENLNSKCLRCGAETTCVDRGILSELHCQRLRFAADPWPDLVRNPTYDSNLNPEYMNLEIGLESYSPISSPQEEVTFRPETELTAPHISITRSSTDLGLSLSINSPSVYLELESASLRQFFYAHDIVQDVSSRSCGHTVGPPGPLLTFDILCTTVNGKYFGGTEVYLFGECLLLRQQGQVICLVDKADFFDVVDDKSGGFTLCLVNEMIPEINFDAMCEGELQNWSLLAKWRYALGKLITQGTCSRSEVAITINGWSLVSPEIRLRVGNPTTFQMPVVPLDYVAANIMLVVNLTNVNQDCDNKTYKADLKIALSSIVAEMKRPNKLALVFIGINPTGERARAATLAAYADPEWEGWHMLIDEIEVYDATYKDMELGLMKCYDSVKFISTKNRVNKVILLDCRQEMQSLDHVTETHLVRTLEQLAQVVSVDVLASNVSNWANIIDHFSHPIQMSAGEWKQLSVNVSCKQLSEVDAKFVASLYDKIFIPRVSLKLQLQGFELAGVKTEEASSLEIVLHDMNSTFSATFNFVSVTSLSSYKVEWLNNSDEVKQIGDGSC